ncbi:unnamed protein product [Owenia fusiformis]|uniref:FAM69 N-terminal domain-containing protein n=1 Tax=Owenia fusiformis TaxID=6347 RepID=A0A8S4PSN4_OWEFU|nr:unnamed protein product [Owenia fusiformis]
MRRIRFMRRSCGRRKVIYYIILIAVAALIAFAMYTYRENSCDDRESRNIITSLCQLYSQGKVAGNLCEDMCTASILTYKKCTNYRGGKHILISDWKGKTVILKTKEAYIDKYFPIGYEGIDGETNIPSIVEFTDMINTSMTSVLGLNMLKQDIIGRLWQMKFDDFIGDKDKLHSAMTSIWSLAQQDEYIMMQYFQNSSHIPEIYGTCGHIYAMEYAPPGDLLDPRLLNNFLDGSQWKLRAKIALDILQLLGAMNNELSHPLHLCDIKGENFGFTETGLIKAIDVDMAFPDPKMKTEMLNPHTKCSKHSDCDWFDCKGWCNIEQSKCTDKRINNNLQAVCEKIFSTRYENVFNGLLQSPPESVAVQLNTAIKKCANPTGETSPGLRFEAPQETFNEIKDLLLKSLSS